jgi:hypothetical protein
MRSIRPLATIALIAAFAFLFFAAALPAAAQYGPGQRPNAPGDANNNPGPAGAKLEVPDYIKPGFQMLYLSSGSTEADAQGKNGSAGVGFTEYTVLAVTKDKVLVSAANYLTPNGIAMDAQGNVDRNTDPRAQFTGASVFAIGKLNIQAGDAMWMPVKELAQWQSGNGVTVQRGPWFYQGQQVNSATITVPGNDTISSSTYNTDNGQKLVSRSATGPMRRNATGNNPYDRKNQSLSQLIATRQIDSPLLGAKRPDWANKVKKMTYAGTYSMAVPGVQPIPVQIASTVEFTDRGEDYILGKTTFQVQNNPPSTSMIAEGPGTLLGHWVHPDVLANLKEGLIDQNEIMHTTITYQIQQGNLGRLGVFVLTNKAQTFYAVSGYNLENGALTYVSLHTADVGTTVELSLQNIESQ